MTATHKQVRVKTHMNEKGWLLVACATFALLAAAAITVPYFMPKDVGMGMFAGVRIAICFLLWGTMALATSAIALIMTLRAWKRLPARLRATGLAPAILSLVGILALVATLEKMRSEAPSSVMPSPKGTTPATGILGMKKGPKPSHFPASSNRSELDPEGGHKTQDPSKELPQY